MILLESHNVIIQDVLSDRFERCAPPFAATDF
jgi:hypothetical protein